MASQEEGIPTYASTQTQTVLASEIFAGGRMTQVEPSITLNTGGAQDLYPALGRQCLLQNSHVTNPCKTQRRTPSVMPSR